MGVGFLSAVSCSLLRPALVFLAPPWKVSVREESEDLPKPLESLRDHLVKLDDICMQGAMTYGANSPKSSNWPGNPGLK